jgi:hypothetical protein
MADVCEVGDPHQPKTSQTSETLDAGAKPEKSAD